MTLLDEVRTDPGVRANAIGLSANAGLAILKFAVGTWAMSEAVVADGFNSAGDIVATAVAAVGYRYAQIPADDNHHYGHGNAENIAGLIVGGTLLATGVFITIEGLRSLLGGAHQSPELPALVAIGITAAVKEALFRYTTAVGTRLSSPALLASARDHRADVWIAAAVFAGVVGAMAGVPWLDPLAAALIGLYIAWMAWEPIRSNFGVLMDEASPELQEEVFRVARQVPEVREAGRIRCHPVAGHFVVDLEIYVDGAMTLHEAHEVAHRVNVAVLAQVEQVRDVLVHVNPTGARPEPPRLESGGVDR